jgi:hypothetical protein
MHGGGLSGQKHRATRIAHDAADTIQLHPESVDNEQGIVIIMGPDGIGICSFGYTRPSEPLTDVLLAARYMAESIGLSIEFLGEDNADEIR